MKGQVSTSEVDLGGGAGENPPLNYNGQSIVWLSFDQPNPLGPNDHAATSDWSVTSRAKHSVPNLNPPPTQMFHIEEVGHA
tara:strand:- start:49 stop:291 length:243 start_codon:yes stop_codon:yes gene_type:complete